MCKSGTDERNVLRYAGQGRQNVTRSDIGRALCHALPPVAGNPPAEVDFGQTG
jgi:hypothetical protein